MVSALLLSAVLAPQGDTIELQLKSTDPRTVAWGAYNASAYHRVDLIPRLQHLLDSAPPTGPLEAYAFVGIVMDSLIQLNARVPANVLVSYADKRPVQTFVLLSMSPDREGALLQLLPRLTGFEWFAAADMLVEDRSPGLGEYLAETVRLQLTVTVSDTENTGFGHVEGGGGGIGCGIGQTPPGYPPHAEYRFESGPRAGFTVLTTGPRPVYFSRTVSTTFQYAVSVATITGPTDDDRLAYLQAMSPQPAAVALRAHTFATVAWSTAAALSQRVEELRSGVELQFRSLVEDVRQAVPGLKTRPNAVLPIEVHLVDRRVDQTERLHQIRR